MLLSHAKAGQTLPSQNDAAIQFVLEGQEEVGSPDFGPFLSANSQLLQADYALSADGGQNFMDQGTLAIGLRGAVAVEVELQTLATDVHSGVQPAAPAPDPLTLTAKQAGLGGNDWHTADAFMSRLADCTHGRCQEAHVHAGIKGGSVLNPINALAKLLAGMVDDDNHITVDGFYE